MRKIQVKIDGEWKDTIDGYYHSGDGLATYAIVNIQDIRLVDESEEDNYKDMGSASGSPGRGRSDESECEHNDRHYCYLCEPTATKPKKIEKLEYLPMTDEERVNRINLHKYKRSDTVTDKINQLIDHINKEA